MLERKAAVRNAADPTQVRSAKESEQFTRESELSDLRALLAAPHGRRACWRLLGHCGVNRSIFNGHGSVMSYNAGMQDVGHWWLAEITEADPRALLVMMQEAGKIEADRVEPAPTPEDDAV